VVSSSMPVLNSYYDNTEFSAKQKFIRVVVDSTWMHKKSCRSNGTSSSLISDLCLS